MSADLSQLFRLLVKEHEDLKRKHQRLEAMYEKLARSKGSRDELRAARRVAKMFATENKKLITWRQKVLERRERRRIARENAA